MERTQHNVSAASAGTSPHSRPRARLTLVLALAATALLAGCAANQRMVGHLSEAEAFLTRAAAAYGRTPPTLKLEGVSNAGSYASINSDDPSAIHIRAEALEWETARLHRILAHEYGHILLGNYRSGTTMAVEIDTDVKAVEILMRADGLTEREAFEAFYNSKGGQKAMRGERPSWTQRPGHGSACDELNAFVARFPAQTWAKTCPAR
jgi:hypothetical protein